MSVLEKMTKAVSSRRTALLFLGGTAATVSMGQLAGCSGGTTVLPGVFDIIQKAVAGVCQVVPAIATLIDVIVAVFPSAAGVSTITDALAKEIADYVCKLFTQAGHVAGHKISKTLSATLPGTDKKVELHGFSIVDGVLTYF